MDVLLGKVTQQAMNYAIRSGVALTATYALKQSARLVQNVPKSDLQQELADLQQRLEHKIRIVSPAIDMIELIAARGNTSLESAVSLTRELRLDIQRLGQRIAKTTANSEKYRVGSTRNKAKLGAENEQEIKQIMNGMKLLLTRIEDAVPLINLALQTSGARLSTQFPSTVSPSRLLQASTLLVAGDTQYVHSPQHAAHIGPTFILSIYMLFAGHDRPETEEDVRNTTWKEVIHKARVKLRRVPLDVVLSTGSGSDAVPSQKIRTSHHIPDSSEAQTQVRGEARSDEYAYQMMIIEDFDDDRHHDFNDNEVQPGPFDDVKLAGIREMIPIHEISKIFYADTSKVLNIGTDAEANNPVLLLRRDVQAVPPRRMYEREGTEGLLDATNHDEDDGRPQTKEEKEHVEADHEDRDHDPWRLPASLDPEWIALEVYTEAEDSDVDSIQEDEDAGDQDFQTPGEEPTASQLSVSLSGLHIDSPAHNTDPAPSPHPASGLQQSLQSGLPQIKTSLSLLELLLRLTSLQQFQQQSHLSITDELLNFFLEESASTGAGGDEGHRQIIRADARRKVGWDPYDESPLKRRGEDYQYGSPRENQGYPSSYYGSVTTPSQAGTPVQPPSSTYHQQYEPSPRRSSTPANNDSPYQSKRSLPSQKQSLADTPVRDTPINSPINSESIQKSITVGNRPEWLKHQTNVASRGSPLRPTTAQSDEGIGTSPASVTQRDGLEEKATVKLQLFGK